MSDLISVIVPIYKVEHYLEKCIKSIIRQTYTNLEIILVDDGSPDNCGDICDDYSKMDSRIRVIHKSNGGLSDARNAGIDVAKGEYLLLVDSDDFININMIEVLYNAVIDFSADIAVCRYENITDDDDRDIYSRPEEVKPIILYEDEFLKNPDFYNNRRVEFTVAWNKLYSKKLFDNVRYPKGKIHEDEFTTYKLLYYANRIVYIPCELYYYVQRDNSIMSAGISRNRLLVLDAIEERLDFYESKGKMGYWNRNFEYYRISYLRYLGALKSSKDLSISDFDKYKEIYRKNMKKYYTLAGHSLLDIIKVWITGVTPLLYARFLRKIK